MFYASALRLLNFELSVLLTFGDRPFRVDI